MTIDEVITEPQQAADYIFNLLENKKDELGLGFLGLNERLTPKYPAVVVVPGGKAQQPHATHVFMVGLQVIINVYHSSLRDSTPDRTRKDLKLVADIENVIHSDPQMNFGGRVVMAYVSEHMPRVAMRPQSEVVIGTQMTISVESRKGFPYVP